MKPEGTRVWRKAARRALRGLDRGRRVTHHVDCQQHRAGSSWHRRHPGASPLGCCWPAAQQEITHQLRFGSR